MIIRSFFLFNTLLLAFLVGGCGRDNPDKSMDFSAVDTGIYRTIDSLNEVAFRIKKNDVMRALDVVYKASYLAELYRYDKGMASSLLTEAGIYHQNGYHKRALTLYYKSLDISTKIKDSLHIAKANQQIGNALMESGDYPEAERLYTIAVKYYSILGLDEDLVNMWNSLGLVKMASGRIDSARSYFNEAREASSRLGYTYGTKKSNHNLGLLNTKMGKLATARDFFLASLAVDIKTKDAYGIALNRNQLARLAIAGGDYDGAVDLFKSALRAAGSISAAHLQIESLKGLCDIYRKRSDLTELVAYQDMLIDMQDDLAEREKFYSMNFLEILKEKEQERFVFQKKIVNAQQRVTYSNVVLGVVSAGLFTLILLTILWYKNYRRARSYSKELMDKNDVIQKHVLALNQLNSAITEQNERLEESNRMKDKLLSIVSHDLRTPLSNTKGILDLVEGNYLSPAELSQLLKDLDAQYVKSLTLLDNLLFWIKGQMSGSPLESKVIDLKPLIDSLCHELEISAAKKDIALINDIHAELSISGDREMIKVVFRNLLTNALKFTEKGYVRIYATVEEGITVHVEDSGIGMSEEVLQKVLSRSYFTTKGTHKESGTGFGLLICKDLIEKHGASLSVKSEVGLGAVFSVRFGTK
ncbi:tetratricopeptide repeat protein [Arcticibacter sp.]|uniref:ATP-binding protein n=1 Tax=Arcticibacter sp. TaxID=1872630 RepID=UPI00388E2152